CSYKTQSFRRQEILPRRLARGIADGLFAGEVVYGDRVFEQRVVARNNCDSTVGYEVTLAVGFGVVPDGGAFGDVHVAVEDGSADAAAAAYADVREQDAGVYLRVRIHAHVRREYGILDHTSGDDAAIGNDGINRRAGATALGKDELGGRVFALVRAGGPVVVVQVEDGRDRDDIHIRVVVGLECAHVAPVKRFFFVFVDEVIGKDAIVIDHLGQDVLAEIVAGIGVLGVLEEDRNQNVGVEQIDAHRSRDLFRVQR